MPAANLAAIRLRLLNWYETHKRDLPWRRTSDPYAIWISETMLQQTQVATVVPYYNRFMKALPNVKALHRAPLAKVLALWSGLGYYRRAENLKKTAHILVARHRGQLPNDYNSLRALPGIGVYTAGAILSIAFGEPHPAIDGNARRVLTRLFPRADEKEIRDAAWCLVAKSKPGQFNQSLMELGGVLCTPKNPRCVECPVNNICPTQGNARRRQANMSRKKTRTHTVTWPLVIVWCHGKVLLRRRATSGILAGLWEFPGGESTGWRAVQTLLNGHLPGFKRFVAKARRVGEIGHAITNRRIRAPVFLIELPAAAQGRFDGMGWRWVAPATMGRYPTSSMTRKALELLGEYEKSHRK
ncbi:MAG TPA: A/G-specific adenine glycosylase [Candidatus Binatia bacterium]|jgi:A/G-specific adenine glycosylase